MDKILKEQIKKVINENEIFITITKTLKDEYDHDYNIFEHIELREYIRNKDKYEKDFLSVSCVGNFNEIQDIAFEIKESLDDYFYKITDKEKFGEDEDGLNNHINALVEEHMKLYDIEEIQNYMKELLNI